MISLTIGSAMAIDEFRCAQTSPGAGPAPLSPAEFAAALDRIGGFEARPSLAVAVSGGPDSMALVLLAERWAKARGGGVCGLTVDHGLRPDSAAEARQVGAWLAARGIAHEVLVWPGDKPNTRIQEAARAARYALLAQSCRERGVLHLLTAHHRGDLAETHLIRRRARSGADGLAGISAVRELPGCRLVRPLLGFARDRLAALLAVEGQPFISDPSNRDPRFERARLRARVDPETVDAALAETRACAVARIERERRVNALLARAVALHPAGFALLDPEPLWAAGPEIAERALARVAATIGGATYPPRRERVVLLHAALAAEPRRGRTLGGCRFVRWRGHILVLRELAAAAPPVLLDPGTSLIWDRRFLVSLPATAPGPVTVGYLAAAPVPSSSFRDAAQRQARNPHSGGLCSWVPGSRPAAAPRNDADWEGIPPLLHPILPAVWDRQGLLWVPHRGYLRHAGTTLPRIAFRPVKPLSDAGFTVV